MTPFIKLQQREVLQSDLLGILVFLFSCHILTMLQTAKPHIKASVSEISLRPGPGSAIVAKV